MNISPKSLYVGQVSGIDGFNLFVLQPPETSPTKADQFNWFVVGPISSWISVPTGYELSQLNVSFAYSPADVRKRAESRAKFCLPLFFGSRVDHQPSSFVVHVRAAREGQVLNASAQIRRDESGKYSNGTRPLKVPSCH